MAFTRVYWRRKSALETPRAAQRPPLIVVEKREDSVRIVHVEFDRVRRHFKAHHLGHLQLDIAVDEVVVEHVARLEEGAVLVEVRSALRASDPQTVGIFLSSFGGRS